MQLTRVLTLLKYLDRKKITPEAVIEIAQAISVELPAEVAADVATAYKSRGPAGLLPLVPTLLKYKRIVDPAPLVVACPHCGELFEAAEKENDHV